MKALVKSKGEPGIWLDEVPMPGVGHNDVLIHVRETAICGTDIDEQVWRSSRINHRNHRESCLVDLLTIHRTGMPHNHKLAVTRNLDFVRHRVSQNGLFFL